MTQKQKELLLKDLCARLPYGVIIQDKCLGQCKSFLPNKECDTLIDIDVYSGILTTISGSFYEVDEIKPCLFPPSSMTEKQIKEVNKLSGLRVFPNVYLINWYLKNHIDIYGLIPMGLAIDASNLNIY